MYTLYHGDCLEIMPTLPEHSVDAIITDLPYGTTACEFGYCNGVRHNHCGRRANWA
jgi:predicted methyltransferase